MRPNIRISHTLNGRVKDYAAENDLSVPEAYEQIIRAGLAEVGGGDSHDRRVSEPAESDVSTGFNAMEDTDVVDALADWEPKTEANADRTRAEAARVVEWLRDHEGRFKRSEIVDALAPDDVSDRSWWERMVQPALRELDVRGVVEYRENYHDYKGD